ncbi:hypothetical protein [Solicola gregarius]|uniref:Uncharacterized protein n=1 Tax=Solicola gregarius TaxID=2908642 RepID=A0AA46YJ52_9ACTN|nr:hypothetical protein [Solicola gregarius]UYM03882.1 hypothetical protein L0C25_15180 [Solicola gregarius]
MSETWHWLIFCGGAFLIALPFTIIEWKRADRQAMKLVDRLTPPAGMALTDDGTQWLQRQVARRLRWAAVTTQIAICFTAPLVFGFLDVPIINEFGAPMYGAVAVFIGHTVGSTYATVRSACASTSVRRSAPVTPRTLRTYVRGWEHAVLACHVLTAPVALAAVAVGWLTGRFDDEAAIVCGALAALWAIAVGGICLLLRRTVHASPVVDEDLHVARELLLSFAIRSLLVCQFVIIGLVASALCTYAYLTVDGFPWALSVAPMYAVGAIGLGMYVTRVNREDRDAPAPEWYFARTLEPTS